MSRIFSRAGSVLIISSVLIFFLPVLSNSTVINYNYDFASNTFTKVSATYGSVQAHSGYIDVLDGNNLYIAGKGWVDLAAAGVEGKLVDWDYYSNGNQGWFITDQSNYSYSFASNTFTKSSVTYDSVHTHSGQTDVLDGNNLLIAGKGWVDLAAAGVEGKLVDWDYYSNRNRGYFITETPAPVPEPATMILFGTGIAGLIAARRRKKAC